MTLATDYRQNWDFSGNKTSSINFFTSQKLFVRLNYGFWSFAMRARTNSFVKIFASDAADAQTNTFVIENWTTSANNLSDWKSTSTFERDTKKEKGGIRTGFSWLFLSPPVRHLKLGHRVKVRRRRHQEVDEPCLSGWPTLETLHPLDKLWQFWSTTDANKRFWRLICF